MALLDHSEQEFQWRPARQRPPLAIPPDHTRPRLLQPGNDNRRDGDALAPELDCLTGVLPPHLLHDAAARGRELGIGADRVLIAWGALSEIAYLGRFAKHSGIAIEAFTDIAPSDAVLLDDDQMRYAAERGLLPMRRGDEMIFVMVLQRLMARELALLTTRNPDLVPRLRIATAAAFDSFLLRRATRPLAHKAAFGLRDSHRAMSAAPRLVPHHKRTRMKRLIGSVTLAGCLVLPPDFAFWFWSQLVALWFVVAIGLRLAAALLPRQHRPALPRIADADLPVYTIIAALYHEALCVDQLLCALNALDYPREKLDIILAVEADDSETHNAIARFGPMPHLRVMVAPDIAPRTKPKALNCALQFARGSFIAVFDAEDRPDPGQLRAALQAFRSETDDVACVQASLCIDNATDSLFTRMFAAEYAGQFDAVLPGLAAMRLPLPLGGTSNHFRADVLRKVGGWDAWNVTEDADLGLRLARFGYRAVTFRSTTQEEAPISFTAWLKQRSRWMKGWMQAWSVHMRQPRKLWRDAGWGGVVTLNLVIGANIVSALAYPVFLIGLAIEAAQGGRWMLDGLLTPAHFIAITAGIAATAAIGLIGLARRGRLRDGWILLLTPIYWGCLSIGTYRALYQLLRDPYRWEKTEHGRARKMRSKIEKAVSRAQCSTSEAQCWVADPGPLQRLPSLRSRLCGAAFGRRKSVADAAPRPGQARSKF